MPRLNGPLSALGALVEIRIHLGRTEVQRLRSALRPIPPAVFLRALIDTGAESTCMEPAALAGLGLPFTGVGLAHAPALTGWTPAAQCEADLTILHPSGSTHLDWELPDLVVLELPIGVLGYQALIGRDVLNKCDLHYLGTQGAFALDY